MKVPIIVEEQLRKKIGKHIQTTMTEKNIGFNFLCLKLGMSSKTLTDLFNGNIQKINPFLLLYISKALKIDHKTLYKMAGYLTEDDFKESETLKKDVKKLQGELEKSKSEYISKLKLEELSEKKMKELEKFVTYLKNS